MTEDEKLQWKNAIIERENSRFNNYAMALYLYKKWKERIDKIPNFYYTFEKWCEIEMNDANKNIQDVYFEERKIIRPQLSPEPGWAKESEAQNED